MAMDRGGRKVPSIICAARIQQKFFCVGWDILVKGTSILYIDRAAAYDG